MPRPITHILRRQLKGIRTDLTDSVRGATSKNNTEHRNRFLLDYLCPMAPNGKNACPFSEPGVVTSAAPQSTHSLRSIVYYSILASVGSVLPPPSSQPQPQTGPALALVQQTRHSPLNSGLPNTILTECGPASLSPSSP